MFGSGSGESSRGAPTGTPPAVPAYKIGILSVRYTDLKRKSVTAWSQAHCDTSFLVSAMLNRSTPTPMENQVFP